jgi:hypothetical protein
MRRSVKFPFGDPAGRAQARTRTTIGLPTATSGAHCSHRSRRARESAIRPGAPALHARSARAGNRANRAASPFTQGNGARRGSDEIVLEVQRALAQLTEE